MKLSKRIAALGVAALIAGACNSAASPAASGGGGGSADRSGILIEVVTHGQASDPFWSIFKNGVDQAGKDMGVKVEYAAPDTFDMPKMAQLIDAAVAKKPAGLVVSIPDTDRPRPVDPEGRRRGHPGGLGELRLGRVQGARRPHPRRPGRGDRGRGGRRADEGRRRDERALHQPGSRQRRPRRPLQGLHRRASAATVKVVAGRPQGPDRPPSSRSPPRSRATPASTASSPSVRPAPRRRSRRWSSSTTPTSRSRPSTCRRTSSTAIKAGKMLFAIDQQQYLQGYLPIVFLTLYKLYGLHAGRRPAGAHRPRLRRQDERRHGARLNTGTTR